MWHQYPDYDAELTRRLISAYKIDASDFLSQMGEALVKADIASIAKAAYALNRAASILAADVVCAVSKELETAARDGMTDQIPAMLQRLRDENARWIDGLPVGLA